MSSQKPRIIPWLISQIDNKMYPGLEWVNSEHTQFRVPWKHKSRPDQSSDDFKIFEAWAFVSGCYNPLIDQPEPSRWKRNFRSALNKKEGIHVILNRSTDPVNPYKIYEITISAKEAVEQYKSSAIQTSHPISTNNQDSDSTMRALFEELDHLNLYQGEEELYPPAEHLQGIEGGMEPNAEIFAEHTFYSNVTVPEAHLDGATAVPVFQEEQVQSQPVQELEPLQQSILKHFSRNSFETDFEVKIFYRGTLVQTTTVANPYGFYITAEQQPGHAEYLGRVYLPQPALVVTDRLLVEVVDQLLAKLKEGTVVEVREGAIGAKRFGHCKSYWSMTNAPKTNIPNMIDKTEYSILYSIQQFIAELTEFLEHRRKDSPQYSIWICIGEQWPDEKSWQKKCIMVQVTPVVMRLLHELSYSTGASSLKNSEINLEISDSLSSTSNLLSLLNSIEDMMH